MEQLWCPAQHPAHRIIHSYGGENKQRYRFQQTQLLVGAVILKAHTEKFSLFPAAYFVLFKQNPWTLILAVLN